MRIVIELWRAFDVRNPSAAWALPYVEDVVVAMRHLRAATDPALLRVVVYDGSGAPPYDRATFTVDGRCYGGTRPVAAGQTLSHALYLAWAAAEVHSYVPPSA